MSVIENFAALSVKEQRDFAEALIKTLNSEHTFIDNINLAVANIEADDLGGGLIIELSHDPLIEVSRKATWTANDEDSAYDDPGMDADYPEYAVREAEKAFKTLTADLEGYKLELTIEDVDEEQTLEVIVDNISHEDAGIGEYEYWGHVEYDSQPYVEVEGTIVSACQCALVLFVDPD